MTIKLKEITMKIKKNEDEFLVKNKEFGFDDSNRMASEKSSKQNADFLEMSMSDGILQKRDVEINNLVSSINDLSHIFKEMANLVNEQGTILDRIDYNIENAVVNVKKSKHQSKESRGGPKESHK